MNRTPRNNSGIFFIKIWFSLNKAHLKMPRQMSAILSWCWVCLLVFQVPAGGPDPCPVIISVCCQPLRMTVWPWWRQLARPASNPSLSPHRSQRSCSAAGWRGPCNYATLELAADTGASARTRWLLKVSTSFLTYTSFIHFTFHINGSSVIWGLFE